MPPLGEILEEQPDRLRKEQIAETETRAGRLVEFGVDVDRDALSYQAAARLEHAPCEVGIAIFYHQLLQMIHPDRQRDRRRLVARDVLRHEVVLGVVGDEHGVVASRQRIEALEKILFALIGGRTQLVDGDLQ